MRSVSASSAAVVSQASSHMVPVGVSMAVEPELLGGAGDRGEVVEASAPGGADASPDGTRSRLSPPVGRNQCSFMGSLVSRTNRSSAEARAETRSPRCRRRYEEWWPAR